MTKVYGASDDLIEFAGDVDGEVSAYGTDDRDQGVLLYFNDGTLLEAKYGKAGQGIWGLNVIQKGHLFEKFEPCADEDAEIHSDIVYFADGLKWAYAAREWERVK